MVNVVCASCRWGGSGCLPVDEASTVDTAVVCVCMYLVLGVPELETQAGDGGPPATHATAQIPVSAGHSLLCLLPLPGSHGTAILE